MNLSTNERSPRDENIAGVVRSVSLGSEQDAWLSAKRKEQRRPVSQIVRDLIQEAMDREKREATEAEQKPND